MTNSQAASHVSWLVRCSPHALGFSQSNQILSTHPMSPTLEKNQETPTLPLHDSPTSLSLYCHLTTVAPFPPCYLLTTCSSPTAFPRCHVTTFQPLQTCRLTILPPFPPFQLTALPPFPPSQLTTLPPFPPSQHTNLPPPTPSLITTLPPFSDQHFSSN